MQNYMISKLFQDYRHELVSQVTHNSFLPSLYAALLPYVTYKLHSIHQMSVKRRKFDYGDAVLDVNSSRLINRDIDRVYL